VSEDARRRPVAFVTLCAVCLLGFGLLLLVAPAEVGTRLATGNDARVVAQLLGAALIGHGAMTWIARASLLGGIYGRAVTAGNQVHFTIGAFVLIDRGLSQNVTVTHWGVVTFYLVGAAFFAWRVFGRGPAES
jgi:hypothetical protein